MAKRTKQKAPEAKPKSAGKRGSSLLLGAGTMTTIADIYGCSETEDVFAISEQIRDAQARIQKGDLKDIERVLTQQMFLMNSVTTLNAAWFNQAQLTPHKELALKSLVKTSNATRQLALAIATIKNPKRFTVIEKQQNVMVNKTDTPAAPNQLGESTNAKVDTGSQGTPEAVTVGAETVAA